MEAKTLSKKIGWHKQIIGEPGFSLPELLVVSVVGSLILLGAVEIIASHTRTSTRMEAKIRTHDVWTRIQFLLDQEIQEAACTSATNASTLVLSLPPCSAPQDTITYTLSGSNLLRTGPTVNTADGSLIFNTTSTDVITSNLTPLNGFSVKTPDSRSAEYTLSITDPTGFSFTNQGKSSAGQTRSRIIDN